MTEGVGGGVGWCREIGQKAGGDAAETGIVDATQGRDACPWGDGRVGLAYAFDDDEFKRSGCGRRDGEIKPVSSSPQHSFLDHHSPLCKRFNWALFQITSKQIVFHLLSILIHLFPYFHHD